MSNFIQTLVCKVFNVFSIARFAARRIQQSDLLSQTCRRSREAGRMRCQRSNPTALRQIANSYLAAARAELSCAEQETARRRIVTSAPSEPRNRAFSASLPDQPLQRARRSCGRTKRRFWPSLWVIGSCSLLAASPRSLWQPCWSDGHFSDVLSRIVWG